MPEKPQIFEAQKSKKKYVISDYKYNQISKKKCKTLKEKNIISFYHFERKNTLNILYTNIDFLKIKLIKDESPKLLEIEYTLTKIRIPQDLFEMEVESIYNKTILFDSFFIVFAGTVFGDQKKLYNIYDFYTNKV
jgi:hypothetical protein